MLFKIPLACLKMISWEKEVSIWCSWPGTYAFPRRGGKGKIGIYEFKGLLLKKQFWLWTIVDLTLSFLFFFPLLECIWSSKQCLSPHRLYFKLVTHKHWHAVTAGGFITWFVQTLSAALTSPLYKLENGIDGFPLLIWNCYLSILGQFPSFYHHYCTIL